MAYIFGMLMGYICLGMFSEESVAKLTQYVGENIKIFLSYSETLDKAMYFKSVLKKEAFEYVFLWCSGLSVLGVILAPVFMLYKGYILGFTCAFMLKSFNGKGLIFDVIVLLSQNLIKFPALMFAGMCAVSYALKKSGSPAVKSRSPQKGLMGIYTMFVVCAFLFHCAGIYMECYIIPHFIFLFAGNMV